MTNAERKVRLNVATEIIERVHSDLCNDHTGQTVGIPPMSWPTSSANCSTSQHHSLARRARPVVRRNSYVCL